MFTSVLIPSYMLQNIYENCNSGSQKQWALSTLDYTNSLMNTNIQLKNSRIDQHPHPATPGKCSRYIHDAEQNKMLPGSLVREEGESKINDDAVNKVYDYLGSTYQLFKQVYKRDSLDDKGLSLSATVHYDENYANAFWDGRQMVFGDGDGDIFNSFTCSADIIGHELTHGVIQTEANLIYFYQSGALNESIADVFGSLVKQRINNQKVDDADWLIGTGLFGKNITDKEKNKALRSMKEPGTAYDDRLIGKDPQPKHMDDFEVTFSDNFGVHINSGIPNHAFYLFAKEVGGYAWDKAGQVWYNTLLDPELKWQSKKFALTFESFAKLTISHAERQNLSEILQKAWSNVGINV